MKILHLADLHLGKALAEYDLIDDQAFILDQILALIDERNVDAVLIAGDVYDKAVPSEAATRLLDSFLSSLASRKVKTFMISGNHDSDDRLNYGSRLFEKNQIYICAVFDGHLEQHIIKEEESGTEVNICLLPFVKASQVKRFFPGAEIKTYEDAVSVILEDAKIDRGKCNIIVAHQFVAGRGEDPALGGSEGLGTQSVGTVEKIGYACFDGFAYAALGHIHSPQQVGRREIRYAGSPLKYSLSEADNEKSFPLITAEKNGEIGIELIPARPRRNLRHLRGGLRELLDRNNVTDPEDFIYATLTDEEMTTDVMGIFRQVYPYTVKIDYDNSHTRAIEQVDISRIAQNRSFEDLIADFYRQIYGCGISDEEMDLMRCVARETGVLHEAD